MSVDTREEHEKISNQSLISHVRQGTLSDFELLRSDATLKWPKRVCKLSSLSSHERNSCVDRFCNCHERRTCRVHCYLPETKWIRWGSVLWNQACEYVNCMVRLELFLTDRAGEWEGRVQSRGHWEDVRLREILSHGRTVCSLWLCRLELALRFAWYELMILETNGDENIVFALWLIKLSVFSSAGNPGTLTDLHTQFMSPVKLGNVITVTSAVWLNHCWASWPHSLGY